MVYKIVNKVVDLPFNLFFTFKTSNYNLRRHCLVLDTEFCKSSIRKSFFSVRVPPVWNMLPEDIVTSKNIRIFKIKLNRFDLSTVYKFKL